VMRNQTKRKTNVGYSTMFV